MPMIIKNQNRLFNQLVIKQLDVCLFLYAIFRAGSSAPVEEKSTALG